MALTPAERRRYSRHLSLTEIGPSGQEKLRAARMLIVGAGGLGSPAALYLAAAGIGTLGVLDFDQVDESNLQRQVLFDTSAIGASKAHSARARLAALNPGLNLAAHDVELTAANVRELFDGYDCIIDGSDRVRTHYLINDACVLYRKSLVSAAIYRFEGQIMSYVPDRGPCYRCLFPNPPAGTAPNCAEVGVLGVLPGVLGTLQATEAIKLALGLGQPLIGRLLTYDALEMRFHELHFARDRNCAVCGDQPTISVPAEERLQAESSVAARQLAAQIDAAAVAPATRPLLLIDVREPSEFIAGHIKGAINVPLGSIERDGLQLPVATAATSLDVVFICRSGIRSAKAIELAHRAGYSDVRHLEGGMRSWRERIEPSMTVLED